MHKYVSTLETDNSHALNQHTEAARAVHADIKSHTRLIFTISEDSIPSDSTKKKYNTCSSTESKLNFTDDCMLKVALTKKFLEAQNYNVKLNVNFLDNESTIKLIKMRKRVQANALVTLTSDYFI